jgi:hypothetical protein
MNKLTGRRTYVRKSDGAVMVKVAPHRFVNQQAAIALGLTPIHSATLQLHFLDQFIGRKTEAGASVPESIRGKGRSRCQPVRP